MPRRARIAPGGMVFHILNRRVDRQLIFDSNSAYELFEALLIQTTIRLSTRLCAYCLMPNHWHLVLWPREDGEASRFMKLLATSHAMIWKFRRNKVGHGHLYQNRFKSFPIESDTHYLRVVRYVERNALRAGLVDRAEDWRFSSLWWRTQPTSGAENEPSPGPVELPENWVDHVNQPQTEEELEAIRASVERGRPYGSADWMKAIAKSLRLESTLRSRGRPRKAKADPTE